MSLHSRALAALIAAATSMTLFAACAGTAPADQSAQSSAPGSTQSSTGSSTPSADTSSSSSAGENTSAATGSDTSAGAMSGSSSAPSSANAFPVTVKASNGEVTVTAKPAAIASLSPTATEMLYAIGAGDQVKVVDRDSDYPAGLPNARVDAYQLNIESLTSFRPDLVVMSDVAPDQESKFKALGMTVIAESAPTNLDGTYAQIIQLGEVTGHAEQARALVAKMKGEVAAIIAEAPKPGGTATYYYELDQTYYSVTSDTFIGHILGLVGLKSIADAAPDATKSGGYPQLDSEFILKANPGYVFLADSKCCQQTPATVGARPGWSTLGAVSGGRVFLLDDDIASRWGPRTVDLLRAVADDMKAHPVQK